MICLCLGCGEEHLQSFAVTRRVGQEHSPDAADAIHNGTRDQKHHQSLQRGELWLCGGRLLQQTPSTMGHGTERTIRACSEGSCGCAGEGCSRPALRCYWLYPWGWGDTVCTRSLVLAEGWEVMGFVAGRELCAKR